MREAFLRLCDRVFIVAFVLCVSYFRKRTGKPMVIARIRVETEQLSKREMN